MMQFKFKNTITNALYFLATLSLPLYLAACGSIGKSKPAPAVYDFGLSHTQFTSDVNVVNISANESLASKRIRYRLNDQNPTQVFYYAESVWAAAPSTLLAQKLNRLQMASTPYSCGLSLELQAFDHVFTDSKNSQGLVILKAQLLQTKAKTTLNSQVFEAKVAANSNDAKGGVSALNLASDQAINAVLVWGNAQVKGNAACGF